MTTMAKYTFILRKHEFVLLLRNHDVHGISDSYPCIIKFSTVANFIQELFGIKKNHFNFLKATEEPKDIHAYLSFENIDEFSSSCAQ